ncbi:hypothetical protein, partial [Streptomyces erythrochromogenes]|uniref:hypothetical protein n=1 Tax=Streptomyces erythrochromogenes TaxID=285574 RepID=UPI00380C192A
RSEANANNAGDDHGLKPSDQPRRTFVDNALGSLPEIGTAGLGAAADRAQARALSWALSWNKTRRDRLHPAQLAVLVVGQVRG